MKGDPKTSILENMFCQNGGWENKNGDLGRGQGELVTYLLKCPALLPL